MFKNLFRSALAFLVLSFGVFFAEAQNLEIPELNSPVIDEVGILSAKTKANLERELFQFKEQQKVQLQVYVIKSLNGDSIESVAIQVFDKWKLGEEKTDRGLLFLIAPKEKRMRIEVGQGLEGDIPDVIAKRIISDVVKPFFQRGDFSLGIVQGVATIQHYLDNSDPELKTKLQGRVKEKNIIQGFGGYAILIIIGIWVLIFMMSPSLALSILFSAMNSGGRGSGYGGGGGGSWSGGGGSSSGGGASGDW